MAETIKLHPTSTHPNRIALRPKRIVLAAAILLALSSLSLLIDVDITRFRRSDVISGDLRRIVQLSEVFAHGFGIAITIYLLWVLAPDRRNAIPRLAACAILPGLLTQILKLFIVRRRPAFYFPDYAQEVSDTWIGIVPIGRLNFDYLTQSFPSAHAATAVGMVAGLCWLFPQARHLFVLLGFLAAFQRVLAGAHWTSDVLAGAAIGVVICGIVFRHRTINTLFAQLEAGGKSEPVFQGSDFDQAENQHAGQAGKSRVAASSLIYPSV
jgi:membrane-associated phospholipid phosphatase